MIHIRSMPRRFLLALCTLCAATTAVADTQLLTGAAPSDSGGGAAPLAFDDEISPREQEAIRRQLRDNAEMLERSGRLPAARAAGVVFAWPLAPAAWYPDPGYHGISNFVDQDQSSSGLLSDYNCGQRTYDNHKGVDIFLWPFPWLTMDQEAVQIVAAASGTILLKGDRQYDRSCSVGNKTWNAVYIRHGDGSIAFYGHMKNGSATPKGVGDSVLQGEYLGLVGSSGNSTGPHLHLEVYDSLLALIEPFQGSCNGLNPDSWWQTQRPYYDSAINKVMTGNLPVDFNVCPQPETTNAADYFNPGDNIYFTSFYRDQLLNQVSQHTIYRPDSSVYSSWNHSSDATHYAASWWHWGFSSFAPAGPTGTWRYEVVYEGATYSHDFELLSGLLPTSTPSPAGAPTRTATPSKTPLPPSSQDHFMFYRVNTTAETMPFFEFGPIVLSDELGLRKYLIQKLAGVGLPANKNGEGTHDDQTHLVEYKIKAAQGASKFQKVSDVYVVNQCNEFYAQLKGPASVLVPSNKGLSMSPAAPTDLDHDIDHFLCYKAKFQKHTSTGATLPVFPKGIQVDVTDQFQTRRYDLKKITKVCNPVAKSEDAGDPSRWLKGPSEGALNPITSASIRNPADRLVCYKATQARKRIDQNGCGPAVPGNKGTKIEPKQAKHDAVVGVHVNNQFGPLQLDSKREVEFCIPSVFP